MPINLVPSDARYSSPWLDYSNYNTLRRGYALVLETFVMELAHGYEVSPARQAQQSETEGAQ